ncbi:McrC family protein [Pedobacter sp. WC2501]|uniref:McrC family protein n=1 Tax=Pedobacter sp. WC2501 TaxID=3461400 RepID=UPI004045EEE6
MRLFEWQSTSFLEKKDKLFAFVEYLSGVWENRKKYNQSEDLTEEEEKEREIQKQRFFDFTIDGKISARNYVGVVQFDGIRIEVYPKVFAYELEENAKKWQLNLLFWLSYCRKIKFPFTSANIANIDFENFLELMIYVFANFTAEILSIQPFQAYQKIEEETNFLKGSLSFNNYTIKNLATGRWQNFYCNHQPFIYDNQFNQIVKYVTRRLLKISQNRINKGKLDEVLFLLDEVSDCAFSAPDCDKVNLNSLFGDHKRILDLCKLYLSNQVIDMDSDESENFCFLVPMEYVFEDFVYGFMNDKFPRLNLVTQSKSFLALNNLKEVFQIRNDIYIKEQLIIDTKYKIRNNENDFKAGVNQSDLYQMISYALRRNCYDVLLLYPFIAGKLNNNAEFKIPSAMLSEDINIYVKNLDISFDDYDSADKIIETRISELIPLFAK